LNDVIAKPFFVGGFGKQPCFQYIGSEQFIGIRERLLGNAGGSTAENEYDAAESV